MIELAASDKKNTPNYNHREYMARYWREHPNRCSSHGFVPYWLKYHDLLQDGYRDNEWTDRRGYKHCKRVYATKGRGNYYAIMILSWLRDTKKA